MEIDYPYVLSEVEAKTRLEMLGKYLSSKHGIKVTWVDPNKARFSGKYLLVKIEGELSMGTGRAHFKGEDPGFLLRGKAKEYIQEKLAKYLDPKVKVESLPTS